MDQMIENEIERKGAEEEMREGIQTPDKAEYMQRILSLPAEDQAFLDGYLFAKVTEKSRRGA